MLFGAAVVIAFMADRDNDAGLIVIPAMGGDAGAFTQFRTRPVGRHQQARLDDAAIAERHVDAVGTRIETRHRGAAKIDPLSLGARDQRIDQMTVFDHVRERFARLDIARESQEHRAGGVFQFGIGDDHVEDRLRIGRDLFPHPDDFEQPAACRHDGRGARVATRPRAERRIGDDDGNVRAEALTQRQRQRQSGERAAADDNASLCRHAYLKLLHPEYSWAKQIRETRGLHPGTTRNRKRCHVQRPD
jgi:hypothetical protein